MRFLGECNLSLISFWFTTTKFSLLPLGCMDAQVACKPIPLFSPASKELAGRGPKHFSFYEVNCPIILGLVSRVFKRGQHDWKRALWRLMAASVELQAARVRPGRPEALFRLPTVDLLATFQPGRDGRQFLCKSRKVRPQDRPIVVKLTRLGR